MHESCIKNEKPLKEIMNLKLEPRQTSEHFQNSTKIEKSPPKNLFK